MFEWITRLLKKTENRTRKTLEIDYESLNQLLDYSFTNKNLIEQALKHRSVLPSLHEPRMQSNERLELLGDAVLGLAVTEFLYNRYPEKEEGELTAMKSLLVSRKILAKVANRLNLGDYLLLSEAEIKSGGRTRHSIVADAMESVIGAMYLDGGLETARKFVVDNVLNKFEDILNEKQHKNFKSILLEYAQGHNFGSPSYVVRSENGPDHQKTFTVQVLIKNKIVGEGVGKSKKHAEQHAAQAAIEKIMN